MNDTVRALAISSGILSLVIIFTVIISFVTVKRGEAASGHGGTGHDAPDASHAVKETASPTAKGKAAPGDEISVPLILGLGFGLFALTVLLLVSVSVISHL